MQRWISTSTLNAYEISYQEQIEWVMTGLPVYNKLGQRIVEKTNSDYPPPGCDFLCVEHGIYTGYGASYFRWDRSHHIFIYLRYKAEELQDFLKVNEFLDKLSTDVRTVLFGEQENCENEIVADLNQKLVASNIEIEELKQQIERLKNEISCPKCHSSKTAMASKACSEKAAHKWRESLEKAVTFAVDCARRGEPRSIKEHLILWCELWGDKSVHTPRKEAFEAFRRGLPPELKRPNEDKRIKSKEIL